MTLPKLCDFIATSRLVNTCRWYLEEFELLADILFPFVLPHHQGVPDRITSGRIPHAWEPIYDHSCSFIQMDHQATSLPTCPARTTKINEVSAAPACDIWMYLYAEKNKGRKKGEVVGQVDEGEPTSHCSSSQCGVHDDRTIMHRVTYWLPALMALFPTALFARIVPLRRVSKRQLHSLQPSLSTHSLTLRRAMYGRLP